MIHSGWFPSGIGHLYNFAFKEMFYHQWETRGSLLVPPSQSLPKRAAAPYLRVTLRSVIVTFENHTAKSSQKGTLQEEQKQARVHMLPLEIFNWDTAIDVLKTY